MEHVLSTLSSVYKKERVEVAVPITCTDTPKVLRVVYTAFEDDFVRREVICYLQPNTTGMIDILYSHHLDYHRPTETGPWEDKHQFKLPLNRSMMSEISSHVMHEFWSAFGFTVKNLVRGVGNSPIPEERLEGGVKFA